jgi:shikimate dehydrogenase
MTDRYAVIGHPISHSKSPLIHKMFAEQTAQDMSYEAIEAPRDGFANTITSLRAAGYKGCNVTVPFKFDALKSATQLTPRAQSAQAVNTLQFEANTLIGDNTDGAGLVRDIQHNLAYSLNARRVLLLGAGGAAYGVVLPLLLAGAQITVANRTVGKAHELATHFRAHGSLIACSYDELAGGQFDAVINATSSGLSNELPPLPNLIFAPHALAYDMMYGRETPFMTFARNKGAAVIADGLGMLVEQAAEAFLLWRGVNPATAPVIAALRNPT